MDRMTHAQEVACKKRIVDHHLKDSVHVARFAQVEKTTNSLSATGPLRSIRCQVQFIFLVELCELPFLSIAARLMTTEPVNDVAALTTVDRLLTDGKTMFGLGKVLVEKSKTAAGRTVKAGVLGKMGICLVRCRRTKLFDLGGDI